ncbi:MAG TPA: ATP-dependent helicase HrpB [Steroidobacteraceae bacterium]|nr:ATP-dependent helicase HrpB [Steroidobacteraceae bacterium]
MRSGLPIDAVLAPLMAALRAQGAAVLEAPPGAGKSTVVPLALLGEPWAGAGKIVMLEPRRLAARAVAMRMAQTLGENVGETVGYRMRLDTRVSGATRIEVVTEGVLTRMLQADAALEGVAAVIFDEFHERSLQADLGLALTLDARANLRPGLHLLVMSATLDGAAVARLIGDAPLISAPGRSFPVTTHYLPAGPPLLPQAGRGADTPERRVTQLIRRALRESPGDVLAFLPGAREIRRVAAALAAEGSPQLTVLPLFADLPAEAQRAALAPAASAARKVVLATNIAETSLTIEGVSIVVDSGLTRRARFDPATGMGRLETQRISRASAEQRQGRAGRTQPGVCYRAWGEGAHAALAPYSAPEILDADLTPLALELAGWGAQDAAALRWLDAPPAAQLASARDLLARLGALDAQGRISAHGREMARLPLHPRLAHLLLNARSLGLVPLAAQLAALLSERDLLRGQAGARDADIRSRLELLNGEGAAGADRFALERARRAARELQRQAGGAPAAHGRTDDAHAAGLLLAFAYPDRIARRRPGGEGRYSLTSGRGAAFAAPQSLAQSEFIVAVDLDDAEREARILLAAPLSRADLEAHFAAAIRRTQTVEWNAREEAVSARRSVQLDALVLEEGPLPQVPPAAARAAMLAGVRALGLEALPWDREARELRARLQFVRAQGAGDWPEVSRAALEASLEEWLAPWLEGVTRRTHLARVPLAQALLARLSHAQQRELDAAAPTHLTLPTGTRVRIDYEGAGAPLAAVRLQEVFGLAATPRLGRAQVPVTLQLLSPAQRPLQVTRDLASFWRGAYAQVRKDMRGRYPRHDWPEDPLSAAPTRGVRRKR